MKTFGPGVYYDMDAATYHSDPAKEPSLSSSIAKILLSETPKHARLAHPRLNPNAKNLSTRAMDIGSVAHEIILGSGGGFEVSPFDDYRKKDAREWRDEVLERGAMPIKEQDYEAAKKMAVAVHRRVAETPGMERAFVNGTAETVIIWEDDGTLCRAMIDWFDIENLGVTELKTTGLGLSDRALQTWIASGLDLQAAFHLRGIEKTAPCLAESVSWRWIFVQTEEPFESRVIELDEMTRAFGDRKAAFAIKTWQRCMTTNIWPGYPRKIERLSYPAWAEASWLAREMEADADKELIL